MADEAVYVRRSVKDLAAGLNQTEVGRVPVTSKPAKPLPSVKPKFTRSNSAAIPPTGISTSGGGNQPAGDARVPPQLPIRQPTSNGSTDTAAPTPPARRPTDKASVRPPPPSLPARRQTDKPDLPARRPSEASTVSSETSSDTPNVPALPQRRPTDATGMQERRKSQQSTRSVSSVGSGPRVRAPEYDPTNLPPLPPKRSVQEKENEGKPPPLPGRNSSVSPLLPSRAPKLPTRSPALPDRSADTPPTQPPRRLPPTDVPKLPTRTNSVDPRANGFSNPTSNGVPPPVPLNSRPDLSKIMATKPKYDPNEQPAAAAAAAATPTSTNCLTCYDFSGPDNHAARFPRHTVRTLDELARDLTRPFYSPTDKARVIFTWMHHNVGYDVDAFFKTGIKNVTPLDTLHTGLAVCAGYAGLYADLCLKAGLECVVVGGHGKGYGYKALQPGEPVPPEQQGHAWNAVKIDVGGPGGKGQLYWKLCDPCWGAGNVSPDQKYTAAFKPGEFAASNEDFGRTHFPEDKSQFFRADGRRPTWAEYYVGDAGAEPVEEYADAGEGIRKASFVPRAKRIAVDDAPREYAATNGVMRFQFNRVCEHWKPEVNGKGKDFIYVLAVHRGKWVPFQSNGYYWWCDVPASTLGPAGETLNLWCVTTMFSEETRGYTVEKFLEKQRQGAGMSFSLVARWDLV